MTKTQYSNIMASNQCQSIIAALGVLSENAVIAAGAARMEEALASRIDRATKGDKTTPETLANWANLNIVGKINSKSYVPYQYEPKEMEQLLEKKLYELSDSKQYYLYLQKIVMQGFQIEQQLLE